MHPIANIRGSLSHHLAGKRIVLGVCGSIAAVKTVELARELARHGADVIPVMTDSASRILHPDALEFATGHKPILRLTGAVEHVALLGNVPDPADLLLVAPATANTIAKIALGIDDTAVTTCATVALGSGVPIVLAPAMHEVMLDHPVVAQHVATLRALGVTVVAPQREEAKAKLADVEELVEEILHRLAGRSRSPGPLAGQRALVISGATAEPVDPVRILTNTSSGQMGIALALELSRAGADVELWQGHATHPLPAFLAARTRTFSTHAQLMQLARKQPMDAFAQVWMPAAIGDYAPSPQPAKIPSELRQLTLELRPLPKVVEVVRKRARKAVLVAFKAESDASGLESRARQRLARYGAQFVVANASSAFAATTTEVQLVSADGSQAFHGSKPEVARELVAAVAASAGAGKAGRRGRKPGKAGEA